MKTQLNYIGIEFDADFDYQPEERAVMYPNDKAYPGCPAQVELYSLKHQGTEFIQLLPESHIKEIEEIILNQIK